MAGETYTLAQVQADIATTRAMINRIMTDGQAAQMDGSMLTLANLSDLRAHLKWLLEEEQRLIREGGVSILEGTPA